MTDENEESSLAESNDPTARGDSTEEAPTEGSESGSQQSINIVSDVILPEYEPLDLPYSKWRDHRSQELLSANGFGDTPAEWRRAAGHSSGLVRGAAYMLLIGQPDTDDEALFRRGLEDTDQTVQALAAFGLHLLGDSTAESVLGQLARLDVDAHLAAPLAASLLALKGDPSAFETMELALGSDHGYVRLSAMQYAAPFIPLHGQEYAPNRFVDIWAFYCRALGDDDAQVRAVAELQLAEFASPEALQLLDDCAAGP